MNAQVPPTSQRPLSPPEERYVILKSAVHADFPFSASAPAGRHLAYLNPHGAVSVKVGSSQLGLKPGEFYWESECPNCNQPRCDYGCVVGS